MDGYKILANDYEALNPKEEIFKQKDFFDKLIKDYSVNSCLDCACGMGWHLFMLNELGIECFGSDLSSEMLSFAAKNLEGINISLKQGDYRRLSDFWNRKFDMIICMSNSLNHMLQDNDTIEALNSMYEQLNVDGILVIDNGISDRLIKHKPKFIPARILKDTAFYFFLEYPNENEMIFNILCVKKTENSFEQAFDTMTLNAMKKSKLENLFLHTHFGKIDYFGDHGFGEYSIDESGRLIAIAQKL